MVTVSDPNVMRAACTSTKYTKSKVYDAFHFYQENIFSTRNVEFHKKLKRIISPVFSATSVAELEPLISKVGVELLAKRIDAYAAAEETFDISALLHYTTLDIIGAVSFGGSFNTLVERPNEEPHPVIHWINDITMLGVLKDTMGLLCSRWTFPKYFRSEKRMVEFTRNAILKRMEKAAEDKDDGLVEDGGKDVLLRLIESEDPETGEKLDIDQLIAESIVQLTLHLLHDHPAVCRKLFDELKQAIPDVAQVVHHDQVKGLPYLNAVIYESMRMRPVAGGSIREVPAGGIEIDGHHIPEGYTLVPALWAIHTATDVFGADAEHFRPERWLEASAEELKRMKQSFFGFSMGSRACLGQNLAWMELRLLLSTLVRRFEFTVPAGEEADMTPLSRFTSQPKGGCYRVRAMYRSD
ncbi:cytochrome P450 [Syncephalis pseudoplumigaleata]|uniref:Cytochrome P450 n=1 Tax=Syncephalis pseudoplumigaleata TaxID=1712513 RepID=A0A4V1J245_9FUNG|nr:cytochrome P450 [Syncephalis pseudoplumigaleata]|eukprot:RKP27279.1 cytochrome P450 [Syncephalis pseudoplumigaleata]